MRLLKYTFAGDSVNLENSIQAGLGCVCLPAPIINANPVATNLSDLVAVKVYPGNAIALFVLYASVAHRPINFSSDGGVHQGFDLTHGRGVGG